MDPFPDPTGDPMTRFSIRTLMATTLVIGLSFAALRINSVLCGGIILLATLALLCSAILMSFAESGQSRMAWIGCAVFGWPFFMVGFWPANERLGPPRTTDMFEEAIPYINPELASEIANHRVPARKRYSETFVVNITTYVPGLLRYRQSSHSVLTLSFAAIGAILGYSHTIRRDRATATDEAAMSEI
jgi:apolipoprotein N-acyltransferase